MANRPETAELDAGASKPQPFWRGDMRVTKEQLAAAERTREYHVRKLQSLMSASEPAAEDKPRQEH